jgi:hypothetical protein
MDLIARLTILLTILAVSVVSPQPASATGTRAPADDANHPGALSWRYIGIKEAPYNECPVPSDPNWRTAQLFRAPKGERLSTELATFCLYTAVDPPPTAELPPALRRLLDQGLVAIDADHMVIAPSGILDQIVIEPLLEATLAQTHPLSRFPFAVGRSSVRLALLDTSPTAPAGSGIENLWSTSSHGYGLANLMHTLTCDQLGTCAVGLSSRLAMPLVYRNERLVADTEKGGYFGTVGQLADAISAEVVAWTESGAERNLVLNLSLAWSPAWGGDPASTADWPPDVHAVRAALRDAACREVLVVAAAGNHTGGPWTKGPLLPAGWEVVAAPTEEECRKVLGISVQRRRAESLYQPLVFAASGIDGMGTPLGNALPSSAPHLAAYADHATVKDASGTPTPTLTGSSVSAAVVSSAAAMMWSLIPDLSPFDIMEALRSSGEPLGRKADFCLWGYGCGEVRRISICPAVAAACRVAGGCARFTCEPWQQKRIRLSEFDRKRFAHVALATGPLVFGAPQHQPLCGPQELYNADDSLAPNPCPLQLHTTGATVPWTVAQPPSLPCPNCTVSMLSGDTLMLSGDQSFALYSAVAVTVVQGTSTATYNLTPLPDATEMQVTFQEPILEDADSVTLTVAQHGVSDPSPMVLSE